MCNKLSQTGLKLYTFIISVSGGQDSGPSAHGHLHCRQGAGGTGWNSFPCSVGWSLQPQRPPAAPCGSAPSSSLRPREIPAAWSLSPPGLFSEDSPKEVRCTRIICHLNTESQTCRIPSPLPIIMGIIGSIVSQKRYVQVLTPRNCECDLIWKESLCRFS